MDIAFPIRAVIPSLEGPLLAVLAGTTAPLTLSEISRLTDEGSISGIRKALGRLTHQGVVARVPGGYVLNREHLAARAIDELAGLRSEFARRLSTFVEELDHHPRLLAIFGSYSRRDGDADSDIDILLVTDSPTADLEAGELASRVRQWTGNPCHVVALSPADVDRMRRGREPILTEWERELLVVTGSIEALRSTS